MRRFFFLLAGGLLGLACFLGFRAAGMPWAPQADWDILGILWLLQNFPKIAAWGCAFGLGALALMCWRAALRLPRRSTDPAAEDRRLLGYMLANPVKRQPEAAAPPDDPGS